MKRRHRASQIRAVINERGPAVFRKYAIQQAVLFGSVLDERCEEDCDIDLLVTPLTSEKHGACRRDLEGAFSTRVDLYTDRDEPQFVSKVMARGMVVYAIQP